LVVNIYRLGPIGCNSVPGQIDTLVSSKIIFDTLGQNHEDPVTGGIMLIAAYSN